MIKFSVVKGTFTTSNIFNFGTVLTRVKKMNEFRIFRDWQVKYKFMFRQSTLPLAYR